MIFARIKRFFIGEPLSHQLTIHETLPKWKALAVLSSDALSSVAYATEEMLIPLAAFASAAMTWSMPIAVAIGVLLVIITVSYRQTIDAYPGGGGAFVVAKENLGVYPGLVAGASLLIDYIMTVAVSVAAGVAAIASAFPVLYAHKVGLGVILILLLMVFNLRGIRESASILALPTYLFVFSFITLLGMGAWKLFTGEATAVAPIIHEVYPEISLFIIFRAFSSGCAALTGIEAISNNVTAFRSPVQKNAKTTMAWMAFILASLFLGITLLAHVYGIVPVHGETAVSTLARAVVGGHWFYYVVQGSTALILVLAANTSYASFPVLTSLLAKDRFLPRQMASLGDKLVFSNGIMGLSAAAVFLIVFFKADVHHLIPLYAIGVFLSFTLSQAGMVMLHLRKRKENWIWAMSCNAVGGITTLAVLLVISFTKFTHGAWIVFLLIPLMVFMFYKIHAHYIAVGKELSLVGLYPVKGYLEPLKHTVIVPISGMHRGIIDALRYAVSISNDVRACYVELDPEATERMQEEWKKWASEIPLVVLKSPYRSVIAPILEYINDIEEITHNEMLTVLIPEFVTARWTNRLLHNQTALLIRAALSFRRGKVVTSVRYHLRGT